MKSICPRTEQGSRANERVEHLNNENENLTRGHRKRPKKRITWLVVARWVFIAVFAGVFVYSACMLGTYYLTSYNTQKNMANLKNVVVDVQATPRPSPTLRPTPNPQETPEAPKEIDWKVNEKYHPLVQLNSDVVGWIRIEGTNIDYPIMQTSEDDPEYYLNHNFEKNSDVLGLPFLDARCELMPNSDVMLIYAHNIRSKIMFHHLTDYESEEFWLENQYVAFDTIYAQGTYQIFAVFRFDVARSDKLGFQFHRYVDYSDEKEFAKQMEYVRDAALYDTGIAPVYGDKLLVLATCEYSTWNSRLVVFAREVEYIPTE